MRANFELEIRWENGDIKTIPMHATSYQAHKALTALGFALNRSEVKEIVMWVCSKFGKVQHNRVTYGRAEKSQAA